MVKKRYKFLVDGASQNGQKHVWELGKWYKIDSELKLCQNGFHSSKYISDALSYVQGNQLAVCDVRGAELVDSDKQCNSEMRVVKIFEWTPQCSQKLAIFAAELVIGLFEKQYPNDLRPRNAIIAAKKYLNDPTPENKADAAYAAYAAADAARDADAAYAAYAAADAARAADAAYAARAADAADAAYAARAADAARAAADAAADAARAARAADEKLKLKINNYVLEMLAGEKN